MVEAQATRAGLPDDRVRVGVVGLGEVAQIIHLPILESLASYYEVAAICDISAELMKLAGERYGVQRRYHDFGELVEQPDLDAVLVLNSPEYHADVTVAALRAGKSVLVEKPMCFTQREADEIIAARDEHGGQVMVAYMRRYAPAFLQAVAEVASYEKILFARFRDIIGPNRWFIDQTAPVRRPADVSDIPAALVEERTERGRTLVAEAIGDALPQIKGLYRFLGGLSSHDTSAMREVVGMPKQVVAARHWEAGGRFLAVLFEHDGFCTSFETGADQASRGLIDMDFEVYGPGRSVQVSFDSPFVRQVPVTLRSRRTVGEEQIETVVRPTYRDPYTCELLEFYRVTTEQQPAKTTPEDYKQDLTLFTMIIDAVKAQT